MDTGTNKKMSNYEILGLPENAPENVVKKKYGALLRQYKQKSDEYGVTDADVEYYERITKAYDEIMGITHDFSSYDPSSPVPYSVQLIWGKVAAFFGQYNILIITVLLVIIGGIIFFLQVKSNGKEDLSLKFVGAYCTASDSALKDSIDEKSEVIENVQLSFFSVTTETSYDTSSQTQATAFLSQIISGNLDVVLIDKESFDVYVAQQTFMKLDDFVAEYYSTYGTDKELKCYEYESGEDSEVPVEHGIYGIDITYSSFFDDMNLAWMYDEESGQDKSMIFTICYKAKKADKAKEFGTELINLIENVPEEKVELRVGFAGAFSSSDVDLLEENIEKNSETVENIEISFYDGNDENAQPFTEYTAYEKIDAVILDAVSYGKYVEKNAFMKLDGFVEEYQISGGENNEVTYYEYEPGEDDGSDTESGIYGIDVSGSAFFEGMDIVYVQGEEGPQRNMIFAICGSSENVETAELFVKEIIG